MGLFGTSTDELKHAGLLVHDEKTGSWVDFREHDGEEPLSCQHINLCFDDGTVRCRFCGVSRETEIEPEPATTIWDWIREARQ